MTCQMRYGCSHFPCLDVDHETYRLPDIEVDPQLIRIALISEAPPTDAGDYYYADGRPQAGSLFEQTTVLAFQDAGVDVTSLQELLDLGIYFTTAIKCAKRNYTVKAATLKTCSKILEQELSHFRYLRAYLLMGDMAIRSLNYIAQRSGAQRVIPAGSTYKIRGAAYRFHGVRAFPSYLQAGPSFFIEKSKRAMIAEDISAALRLLDTQSVD